MSGCIVLMKCQSPVAHSCGLLNHMNSFCGRMFKLKAKFDAYSLLSSLSHFEHAGHTVHKLTPRCLLPPLTSTVKSSLFTNAHSSPISLAARLCWCCTNHCLHVNNGWTFSGHTWHICAYVYHRVQIFKYCNKTYLCKCSPKSENSIWEVNGGINNKSFWVLRDKEVREITGSLLLPVCRSLST